MKRPLCVIGACLVPCVAVSFFMPARQALLLSLAAAFTGLLFLVLRTTSGVRSKQWTLAAVIACSVALGLGYGGYHQLTKIDPFTNALGDEVWVEGIVTEAEQTAGRSWRYTLQASFPEQALPAAMVVVRHYGGELYLKGDVVRVPVRLQATKYDTTRSYYRQRGIVVEGVLLEEGEVLPPNTAQRLQRVLFALQKRLSENVYHALPPSSARFINTMILGIKEELPASLYTAMNQSGTIHVLSISGFHFSVLLGFLQTVLGFTGLSRRKQVPILFLLTLTFTAVVSSNAPVVRSFVMGSVMLLAQFIGKRQDSLSSLGLSAILIVFIWPQWTLTLGMWLSFLATAGILLLGAPLAKWLTERYQRENKWYNWLVATVMSGIGITLGAYVMILPVLVVRTGWFSVISPVSNVAVTPFSVIATVGGMLLALVPNRVTGIVVDFSVRMMIRISEIMAAFPFATFSMEYFYQLVLLGVALGVAVVVVKKRKTKKVLGAGIAVTVFLYGIGHGVQFLRMRNTVDYVTLRDCSTSVLIRGNHAVLLGSPSRYETSRVQSYLHFRGVKAIDALVMPAYEEQVETGLLSLAEAFPIKSIIGPDDSYTLDTLALALPGISLYSAGYAETEALGALRVTSTKNGNEITVQVGEHTIIKTTQNYGILEEAPPAVFIEYADALVVPPEEKPTLEPIGSSLFGEVRFYLGLHEKADE